MSERINYLAINQGGEDYKTNLPNLLRDYMRSISFPWFRQFTVKISILPTVIYNSMKSLQNSILNQKAYPKILYT